MLMMQVSGSTEEKEMSEGNRRKGDYITKFRITEFRLITLSARLIKSFLFH